MSFKCKYNFTRYENPSNGFSIVSYVSDDPQIPDEAKTEYPSNKLYSSFMALGRYLPQNPEVEYILDGTWELDSVFGLQLRVEVCDEIMPGTLDGIKRYLNSGLIKGIGDKTADELISKFGTDTLKIIEDEPEKLLAIKGISSERLEQIIESFALSKPNRELMIFLGQYGISDALYAKIRNEFGSGAMFILKKNPYVLCSISGVGFKKADDIARKMGAKHNDQNRIKCAILHVLKESKIAGHLFLPQRELYEKSKELLDSVQGLPKVSNSELNNGFHSLADKNEIVHESGNIYSWLSFRNESESAKAIALMLSIKCNEVEIEEELINVQDGIGIELSERQQDAVRSVFLNMASIITGGPGTGKTTVLKVILEIYRKIFKDEKILLAAPTGKAARRMAESTGMPAYTLHKSLQLRSDDDDGKEIRAMAKLEENFIIVDEFSMVDMGLAYMMLSAINEGARLLFVGDADQLPSVGAGNVFRELIQCGLIHTTYLDNVYRQSSGSLIAQNAAKIKNDDINLLYGSEFEFIECETSEEAAQIAMATYEKELEMLEQDLSKVQILTPFRKRGNACSNNLNEILRERINPPSSDKPEIQSGLKTFRLGDRIMQIKNKNGISNGEIGFAVEIDSARELILEFSDSRIVHYNATDCQMLELSYATTIHKSQGSEYETVIITILNDFFIMLRRNLIYTAITRAKKKVVLIGHKQALATAILKNDIDQRNTLLCQRILNFNRQLEILNASI
ncbi:MAG: ATP-dependent RecD-like DNA helicase [Clostridiales bacterium]|nr:ATP-dependent RecD-like DNA helicase [Clostridiales bacterium]